MNIPKIGQALAELNDALVLESKLTTEKRYELKVQFADFKSEVLKYVNQSLDAFALKIDDHFGEHGEALASIIDGEPEQQQHQEAA